MDQEMKKRYQELKRKNSKYTREKRWKSNTLLQECLSALGSNKIILNIDEQKWVLDKFNSDLPGLMNCDGENMQSIQEMLPRWANRRVYIVWDEADLPVIETDFECV